MAMTANALKERDTRCRDRETCEGFRMGLCSICEVTARASVSTTESSIPKSHILGVCPDIDHKCGQRGLCNTKKCPLH